MKLLRLALVTVLLASLSACSWFKKDKKSTARMYDGDESPHIKMYDEEEAPGSLVGGR